MIEHKRDNTLRNNKCKGNRVQSSRPKTNALIFRAFVVKIDIACEKQTKIDIGREMMESFTSGGVKKDKSHGTDKNDNFTTT